MRWLLGLPLLPLAICGAMCLVPAALVALGLRRRDDASRHAQRPAGAPEGSEEPANIRAHE